MFKSIAIQKLNLLIQRDDFLKIDYVCDEYMIIKFKEKECIICNFGRVEWKV